MQTNREYREYLEKYVTISLGEVPCTLQHGVFSSSPEDIKKETYRCNLPKTEILLTGNQAVAGESGSTVELVLFDSKFGYYDRKQIYIPLVGWSKLSDKSPLVGWKPCIHQHRGILIKKGSGSNRGYDCLLIHATQEAEVWVRNSTNPSFPKFHSFQIQPEVVVTKKRHVPNSSLKEEPIQGPANFVGIGPKEPIEVKTLVLVNVWGQ
jgi:hypothetical protein